MGEEGCEHPLAIEGLPLSVAAWVRVDSLSIEGPRSLFSTESGQTYAGAWVSLEPTGAWFEPVSSGEGADSSSRRTLRADGELQLRQWYHVAVTFRDRNDQRPP